MTNLQEKTGLCQWFHFEDRRSVERAVRTMKALGLHHLRTGISWADYYRPGGPEWLRWQLETLHGAGLELLACVWHTPPSLAEGSSCSGPPRHLQAFADFIDVIISEYGHTFEWIELWNEPNNILKWNFRDHDPNWRKFGEMIGKAAYWAHRRGKRTVLGGIIPVDHHWLALMKDYGVLPHIDRISFHAFPDMWWDDHRSWDQELRWKGWQAKFDYLERHTGRNRFWVTETGFATWDQRNKRRGGYVEQVARLRAALLAPAERLYWYSAIDLAPHEPAIEMTEGNWFDAHEYHLGLESWDGWRKPAWHALHRWVLDPKPLKIEVEPLANSRR